LHRSKSAVNDSMTPFTYEIDFTLFVAPETVEESKQDGNHQPQYKPANIRGR